MKKNLLMGLVCPVMALASVATPVFAAASNVPSQTTQVEYSVNADAEGQFTTPNWVWEVPATQTFTDADLDLQGTVKISPAVSGKVLVLTNGTKIDVTLRSANGFKLQSETAGDKSAIIYQVKKGDTVLTNEAAGDKNHVLNFTAGTSANTGVEQPLDFVTTPDNLKAAKLTGAHTDTITFTVAVTPST